MAEELQERQKSVLKNNLFGKITVRENISYNYTYPYMSCHSILDFYVTCLGNIFKRATDVLRNVSKLSFIKGYITMTRNVILVLSRDFSSRTDTLSTGFSHIAAHVVLYLCNIKILLMYI